MRIGVDFDNTIACYDGVFHTLAVAQGLIPASVSMKKTAVRDYLRGEGKDAAFTALQGFVYGPGMRDVGVYPGSAETLRGLATAGHKLFLISHKTRTPFAGPSYDLHKWAWVFLREHGLVGTAFQPDNILFEPSAAEKIARIASVGCAAFIDDLPEILTMPGFPETTRPILFDPDDRYAAHAFERCRDWQAVGRAIG